MLDVDLNLVIETDLHLLTVIVIQLGLVPPLCVISLATHSLVCGLSLTPVCLCTAHRHRINKYLDTLLANQPISDGEASDHCQKGVPQDGRLPELIVARSCLTNHSEAASL